MRKCYYEILGLEKTASSGDIKKAYRKLALQMHPDKNPEREEEAKIEFQALQKAYEILSNPQERAWYDEHWRTILREGVDGEFDDFDIDIMAYCTSTCYSGFHDDDGGYYKVYRDLFAKLTGEEIEAGWSDEHDEDIPNFGDSQSSYEEVVGPFYAFWEAFCTVKSFGWTDEYDTRRAGCRRVARLMEKENKKIRSEARKAWNREVRALVDFVKRKDKRVQAWKAAQEIILKQKAVEAANRDKEMKAKLIAERKKILESAKKLKVVPENQKLKEMEAWMSAEFGEQNSDEDSDEEDPTCFHCAACNKSFRSEKAFCNHEKSKKHLSQVERLRELLEEEDEQFESGSIEEPDEACGVSDAHKESGDNKSVDDELENISDSENHEETLSEEDDDVQSLTNGLKNATLDVKVNREKVSSDSDNSEDSSYEEQLLAKMAKKNKKSRNRTISIDDPSPEIDDVEKEVNPLEVLSSTEEKTNVEKLEKRKKRKAKNQQKKTQREAVTEKVEDIESDDQFERMTASSTSAQSSQCAVCQARFTSRSLLFKHIKSTNHAAPPMQVKTAAAVATASTSNKQKKKKGKK